MRLTKTYEDGSFGIADDLPCGENSHEFKKLVIDKLGAYEDLGHKDYAMNDLTGIAMKFTVIKNSDVEKLGHHAKVALGHVAEEIQELRENEGKKDNVYLVINSDEPYADQIIEIMKSHGHWG